jgi:hypothetical protein
MSWIRGCAILLLTLGALVVPATARASLLTSADFTVLGAGTNDLSFFGTFTNDRRSKCVPAHRGSSSRSRVTTLRWLACDLTSRLRRDKR